MNILNHFANKRTDDASVSTWHSLAAIALRSSVLPISVAILVATLLAYFLFFASVKQHHMDKLVLFSKERAHHELRLFELAKDNLELIKEELISKLEKGHFLDDAKHLRSRIEQKSDGTRRNIDERFDANKEAQLLVVRGRVLSPIAEHTMAIADQLLSRYGPAWGNRFVNTYFLGQEGYSSCFWHGERFIFNLEPDFTHLDKPYYLIGTPENNSQRNNRWTSVYLDDTSKKWMVSSITPVYFQDQFLGIFGHDIYLDNLMTRTINDHPQGTKNMLMTRDGQLIAHPDYMDLVLSNKKSLKISDHGDANLQAIFQLVSLQLTDSDRISAAEESISPQVIDDDANNRYLIATPLRQTNWILVSEYPKELVAREAAKSARAVFFMGAILLLIELISLFYIIKIKVSQPLAKLSHATSSLEYGDKQGLIENFAQRKDEVGRLSQAFKHLQGTIIQQFQELHDQVEVRKNAEQSLQDKGLQLSHLNTRLDQDVKARTADLQREIEAKSKLTAAMEHAAESIIIMNRQMVIEYANPSFFQQFGYSKEEVLGGSPMVMNWNRSKLSVQKEILSTLERGEVWFGQVSNETKNGKVRHEEITISPIRDEVGEVTHYVEVKRDITERMALEEQLQSAQKLESIGQLAAGIAHEINTPTQYIGDNTNFLKGTYTDLDLLVTQLRKLPEEQDLQERVEQLLDEADIEYLQEEVPLALEQCLEGVDRVSKIVHAMKNFSHQSKEKTLVDLNQAIQSTITVATNEWKYVADLETHFDSTIPLVFCEPGEINQVVLNMIVNAAHAIDDASNSGKKGLITIQTRFINGFAEIHIQDNGSGMSKEVKERVFDPFFTTKEVGKGTGQGLSIAHTFVVKNHNGSISLETDPGVGSCFIIRLPAQTEENESEKLRQSAS